MTVLLAIAFNAGKVSAPNLGKRLAADVAAPHHTSPASVLPTPISSPEPIPSSPAAARVQPSLVDPVPTMSSAPLSEPPLEETITDPGLLRIGIHTESERADAIRYLGDVVDLLTRFSADMQEFGDLFVREDRLSAYWMSDLEQSMRELRVDIANMREIESPEAFSDVTRTLLSGSDELEIALRLISHGIEDANADTLASAVKHMNAGKDHILAGENRLNEMTSLVVGD